MKLCSIQARWKTDDFILTWQRTSSWVRLSRSIFVGFPDISLLPTVPAIQYLFPFPEFANQHPHYRANRLKFTS